MTTPQCAREDVRIKSWKASSTAAFLRLSSWQQPCDASGTTGAGGVGGRAFTAFEAM
eukprot:CAMPEP_0117500418 /NCGR_PEP_ID=MMETSP0784-20121206/22766_1 /TAXON_ID=39447 /ORGANISM="" /LENGTH=56 /DNA_ID=CAMNT_0005295627 /DNA_START=327 /DNA_END=497 /DNA_ORIENTATION=+